LTHHAVRRIIETELKRRQAELDAAQRYADECAERHEAAMRRLQLARAEVVAVTEARYSLGRAPTHAADTNDGSGM